MMKRKYQSVLTLALLLAGSILFSESPVGMKDEVSNEGKPDQQTFQQKSESPAPAATAAYAWYDSAQYRIDALRKGLFTFRIVDINGNSIQDSIRIIHRKHEFPWGTAVDLPYNIGGAYTSPTAVTAPADSEIYRTERFAKIMGYLLPSESGTKYKLTIKLSENYFSTANSRLFDVIVDGQKVMASLDKYLLSGGKNKAADTTISVLATDRYITLRFQATKDNASIMGLVLSDSTGVPLLRINCGGPSMVTHSGNFWESDNSYADQTARAPGTYSDDWLKAVMLRYCNYGVCGNQFKWSGIESVHGSLNYAPFENTLRWFNDVGWDMRAHCLLWGGTSSTDYHELPQWVGVLEPKAMYDTCKMRVTREVTRYRGKVHEYDVLNEPSHATYLQSKVGDSIDWACFKWAHEADPDARLFVNDYNIIEWQDQTNNFVALVKKMLVNGAPVTGIGAQCHIGATTDLVNFKKRFDQLGQFGLPIKVTEFDMGAKNVSEQQYANELSKMMRLAFSHPAIEGFVFWGLTEPTWVPESVINIIREDRTPRIAADSVYHLIHEVWTTRINDETDTAGQYTFKGYFGDYDILVKTGAGWKKFNASWTKAEKDSVYVLHEEQGVAVSPLLKKVRLIPPSSIELTFDKKMTDPSADFSNFKMFDIASNYVTSAVLKSGDSSTIVLTTSTSFADKHYIPVSYIPGKVQSADGGHLEAFGPIQDSKLIPAFISAKTNSNGKTIFVTLNGKLDATSVDPAGFSAKIGSTNVSVSGASVCATMDTLYLTLSQQVTSSTLAVTISYNPGGLMTTDSMYVAAFDLKPVVNNVSETKFVSALTNSLGTQIQLGFSQLMSDPSGTITNYTVKVNGINVPVTKANLLSTNNKTVVLTLLSKIQTGDTVTLSYKPGTLMSAIGVPIALFNATVSNRSLFTSVEQMGAEHPRISPNPARDFLDVINTVGYTDISITDLSGRELMHVQPDPNGKTRLNTSALKSGVYILLLKGEGKHYNLKIIKE